MARWESVEQFDLFGVRPRSMPMWIVVTAMIAVAGVFCFFVGREAGRGDAVTIEVIGKPGICV